jgi:hypothetical protein
MSSSVFTRAKPSVASAMRNRALSLHTCPTSFLEALPIGTLCAILGLEELKIPSEVSLYTFEKNHDFFSLLEFFAFENLSVDSMKRVPSLPRRTRVDALHVIGG